MARGGQACLRRKPQFFKILFGDFSKQLRIPKAFLKHISHQNSKRAILEVRSGCRWHVKMSKDSMYLQDGWATFVKDNSLERTNFLLFSYEGQRRSSKRLSVTEQKDVNLWKFERYPTRCQFSPWEKEKILDTYNSFTSKCPFFRKRMEKSNVGQKPSGMVIPSSFSRNHLPRRNVKLSLRDPKGQSWKVNYLSQSKDILIGGWPAFARSNNLREGDGCIFELVEKSVMQVHVFWLADEPATLHHVG
ncbi:B3 domain-containing protein Os01g0723500-like isoform X2 [Aristolochia californica]|uniref:B3 domain-containing protein Os01g0723500-like isoform X2 n=1 Tax=Aristolochia californica TaxID=171875 RepID=UPI0035DDD2C5